MASNSRLLDAAKVRGSMAWQQGGAAIGRRLLIRQQPAKAGAESSDNSAAVQQGQDTTSCSTVLASK